jgi:hypothetical protein
LKNKIVKVLCAACTFKTTVGFHLKLNANPPDFLFRGQYKRPITLAWILTELLTSCLYFTDPIPSHYFARIPSTVSDVNGNNNKVNTLESLFK